MKNKIYFTFYFSVLFLFSTHFCSASTILTDNFNSYTDGTISGQGGWIGSPFTTVQNESVFEGAKSVKLFNPYPGSFNIEKVGNPTNDGRITLYMQGIIGGTTHPTIDVQLKKGNTTAFSLRGHAGYAFTYYNGESSGYSSLSTPMVSSAWYKVAIEWRGSDHKARYKINDEAFTNWVSGFADWSNGLDTVNIGIVDGVGFIDAIGENPIVNKNPVLIIPGVTGTELFKDSEKLWLDLLRMSNPLDSDSFLNSLQFKENLTSEDDLKLGNILNRETIDVGLGKILIFDYVYSLINEFKGQGYVENETLFTFPYDWRYGVTGKYIDGKTNTDLLAQKIFDILSQTGAEKVDVIAHSMGGLIAKQYIANNVSSHHIDKAIFVGVPNTGAPKAAKTLLQGDNLGSFFVSQEEIKKISQNMPGIYDLLPSQQYYNSKGGYIKVNAEDLNYQQTKDFFLQDNHLNSQAIANAENLHTQNFDNFDVRTAGIDAFMLLMDVKQVR